MDEAMADVADHCNSRNNSAAATNLGWPNWSPVIGFLPLLPEEEEGEEYLYDVKGGTVWRYSDEYPLALSSPEKLDQWSSSSAAATPTEESPKLSDAGEAYRGVRLIHLLTAAAESLDGGQESHALSKVILARLKELLATSPASNIGTERLAGHFAKALHRLLADGEADDHFSGDDSTAVMEASQLLQDMSPYINFGHFTANQAIVEAVGGERRVHIVDFNIMEGAQCAPLLQALVSMKDSPPPSHVKITAVTDGRKSAAAAQQTGRMLADFAASIDLPFSFAQCRLDREGCFRQAALKVLRGEAMVFNCTLHAPHRNHRSPDSVRSFLQSAAKFGARLVTVVEEESCVAAGRRKGGFLGGFMEELQRYSAMWDALEAGFPKQSTARETVERVVFGPRIAGAVEEAFRRRAEEGTPECWSEWMAASDFRRVRLSLFNRWQAKLLLGLFNEGYRLEEDGLNKLVLGWKSRRLVSASVWSAPPAASAENKKTAALGTPAEDLWR